MPSQETLRAMARDLPVEQDAQLAKMLEAALKETRRSGLTSKYLLGEFAGEHYSDQAFEDVLSTLRADDYRLSAERVVCAWILGIAPLRPHHRKEAALVLEERITRSRSDLLDPREQRYLRAWGRSYMFSLKLCALTALLYGMFQFITAGWELFELTELTIVSALAGVIFAFPLSVLVFPVVLPFSLRSDRSSMNPLRFMAARSLGRLGVVESIGALAHACQDKSEGVRRISETALRALLPLLTPQHLGQLGAEVVPDLCRVLTQSDSRLFDAEGQAAPLASELLEALEKVGDSRAIYPVEHIVENGRTDWLKAQAHRVLEVLESRKRLEIERETLLRGAAGPAVRSDQLLRPACAQSDLHPEQLLRAGNAGADGTT